MKAARTLAALALIALLALAACGGDEESAPERALVRCEGAEVVATSLPGDFPHLAGVTYTKTTTVGASNIVNGYYEGALEDAYREYKAALRRAGYAVIFDEIEEHDSEVAYSGGDLDRSGFIALRDNCEQSGRISVHITNRPA